MSSLTPLLPGILGALVAFVDEHLRCGELDGGLDNGCVWLACSCGVQIVPLGSKNILSAENKRDIGEFFKT